MKRPFFSAGPMTALIFLGLLFGLSSLSAQPQTAIVVNDVPIPYEDYRVELVNQLVRSNMPISDTANPDPLLDDGVFLTLVDGELTLQEGKKRGVDLSEEEVIAAILDNPPAFLRGLFEGNFDRGVMRSLLTKPEAIAPYVTDEGASLTRRIAQWKEQVASLKRFYRIQEVTRQLEESLFAAAPLSRHDLEHRYEAARTGLRGSVIRILHSTVPTEEVPVSEQEARTWFTQHIDEYTIPESRLPLTIILPITPSPADSAAQRERLAMIAERIGAASSFAERTAVVDQLEVMLPPSRVPTGSAISPSSFDTEIADELFTAVAGDLVGPFATGGESVYLYVKGTRPSKQTAVRARHILINKSAILYPDEVDQVPEAEAEAAVRQLVTDLADSIATEEDFMRIAFNFSQDVGSGSKGGDLGYRTQGSFVPGFDSLVFAGQTGRLLGPVRTQYGHHLVWIVDRATHDLELVELRAPLAIDPSVRAKVSRHAADFAARLAVNEDPASVLAEAHGLFSGIIVDSGSYLKRLEPYADGLAITNYVYSASIGDAGVVPLPFDRVAVVQLRTIWPGGVPAFEEISVWPTEHARRDKQLSLLEKRNASMASEITPGTLLGPLREVAPMAEIFLLHGQPIPVMDDEDERLLDSLASVTRKGEVSGPVRGVHALYLLRVTDREEPPADQRAAEREDFIAKYLANYRRTLFDSHIEQARAESVVVDMRPR